MDWWLISEMIYIVVLLLVCLRIVYDTNSTTKTLAYLLFAVFLPVFGIVFYFSFGVNYRKRKMYSKKLIEDDGLAEKLRSDIAMHSRQILNRVIRGSKRIKSW